VPLFVFGEILGISMQSVTELRGMKIVFITAKNINLGLESLDFLYIIDPNPMLRNSSLLRRERNG
jgi:hypothetical protein